MCVWDILWDLCLGEWVLGGAPEEERVMSPLRGRWDLRGLGDLQVQSVQGRRRGRRVALRLEALRVQRGSSGSVSPWLLLSASLTFAPCHCFVPPLAGDCSPSLTFWCWKLRPSM